MAYNGGYVLPVTKELLDYLHIKVDIQEGV